MITSSLTWFHWRYHCFTSDNFEGSMKLVIHCLYHGPMLLPWLDLWCLCCINETTLTIFVSWLQQGNHCSIKNTIGASIEPELNYLQRGPVLVPWMQQWHCCWISDNTVTSSVIRIMVAFYDLCSIKENIVASMKPKIRRLQQSSNIGTLIFSLMSFSIQWNHSYGCCILILLVVPLALLWGYSSTSGLFRLPEWWEEYLTSGQGSSKEWSPVGSRFPENS